MNLWPPLNSTLNDDRIYECGIEWLLLARPACDENENAMKLQQIAFFLAMARVTRKRGKKK